jgi:hypothetical protein
MYVALKTRPDDVKILFIGIQEELIEPLASIILKNDKENAAEALSNLAYGYYSLAIRKWEPDSTTDLTLSDGVEWKNDAAFAEIKTAIEDEFGNDVMFRVKNATR